jgi:pimeloyl-ACP methyl ester carboxylesterase
VAQTDTPGAAFREGFVEAEGFRIRYMEAGEGPPLVVLHGAGGFSLTRGHDLLSRQFRVIAFEMPGFGRSPENTRSRDVPDLARTLAAAADKLDLDRYNLLGISFGGTTALWLALQQPECIHGVVLAAPAAIGWAGRPGAGGPEEMARRLYAHPERMPPLPAVDPAVQTKQQALVARLRGPERDPDLEARLRTLPMATLVLFGTLDRVIPPEMGRHYKELIPNCQLVFVYDAGHAIAAERPEAFTDVVGDFLERHEAFVIRRTETLIHP